MLYNADAYDLLGSWAHWAGYDGRMTGDRHRITLCERERAMTNAFAPRLLACRSGAYYDCGRCGRRPWRAI